MNAECDDGGPSSAYSMCQYGTDCIDCGPRPVLSPPTPPAGSSCEFEGDCQPDACCYDRCNTCVGGSVNDQQCPGGYRCAPGSQNSATQPSPSPFDGHHDACCGCKQHSAEYQAQYGAHFDGGER